MIHKPGPAALLLAATLELTTLREAAETFPLEIAPIYALLEYHRSHPLPDEEHLELLDLLVGRLEDDERELPVAVLSRIVRDPAADDVTLRLMAEQVRRRLEKPDAAEPDLVSLSFALHERLQEPEAAVQRLEQLYRLEPTEPIQWALYQHYVVLERWDEAIEIMRLLTEAPGGERLRGIYVRLLGRAGYTEEHDRQVELMLAEGPDSSAARQLSGILWQSAWSLRDAGKDGEAERTFRRLLELEPEAERTRAVLFHLYGTKQERQELAAAQAQRWQQETDPQTLFDEGTQRLMAGDAATALELLQRAAPEFPQLEAAWYNLGMAAYRMEDWETTASAFEKAAELNPERAESFFFGGLAFATLDDCSEVVEMLTRALELDPKRTLAHYHLARCHRVLGNREDAARHQSLYDATREN